MDEFQDQMFEIFLYETNVFLKQLEEILLQVETKPERLHSSVNEIFRIMHTMKSSSAMAGRSHMSLLAHRMEDLFQWMRDFPGVPVDSQKTADILLKCVNYMKHAVSVEVNEESPEALIETIAAYIENLRAGVEMKTEKKADAENAAFKERRRDSSRCREDLVGVEIKKLDELIILSGEILIASEKAMHCLELEERPAKQSMMQLHQMILNLQEAALSLRMVTLGDTFHSLKRSLQEMITALDRDIEFTISGEDNVMDKEIIQFLWSPLMHIAKNAVEHGIESCEERLRVGKKAVGHIRISARSVGSICEISIADDGKGISPESILETAVGKALITQKQAADMPLEAVYSLLLVPGFSTKQEISEYSGRGVGLDAVNEELRKINGRLQIKSDLLNGSEFILQVPITLARHVYSLGRQLKTI